jgi:hypothetical protein
MENCSSVYNEKTIYAFKKAIFTRDLRPSFCKTVPSIIYNFFLKQFYFAIFRTKVPVTGVDHPLDEKIPFVPSWVTIYIDFAQFWIRMIAFFIRRYGVKAYTPVRDFIFSMGDLYVYAAKVYGKNLSTTKRPFYIRRLRFLVIHLLDPHLMCIPSLHVMVVIHAYTMFCNIAKQLNEEENLKAQALEMEQGALAITAAILFVKQHSVNCIPAALYAMTNYNPQLFPVQEAERFTNQLFSCVPSKEKMMRKSRVHPAAAPDINILQEDQTKIKQHILSLYYRFIEEGKTAKSWEEPLMNFLQTYNPEITQAL